MRRIFFAAILTAGLVGSIVGCNEQSSPAVSAPPIEAESRPEVAPAPAVSPPAAETPTPAPTDVPEPEPTATATPIPTSTPTPEPPKVEDYDHDRLAQVLTNDLPEVILAAVTEEKAGGVVQRIEFALRPGTGDLWLSVSIENADAPASMQFLLLGDRAYLRGGAGEESIDWISGPSASGLESDSLAADFTPNESLAEVPLVAVAVEACGEGRFCFVLGNPEEPDQLLLVDTETYVPVAMRRIPLDDGAAGSQVNLTWGGKFDFSPPEDAIEVEGDELGTSLFVLLLALASAESSGDATPPEVHDETISGSRAVPLPAGSMIEANDFSIEIMEVLRGDDALEGVLAASDFNDPPASGWEYVQIRVQMTYNGTESKAETGEWDFRLTGSYAVYRSRAQVFQEEPGLDATLVPGGTAEGWVGFEVPADETDLILVYDPFTWYTDDPVTLVALDLGASVVPDSDLFPEATDAGLNRSAPAAIGEPVVNDEWEYTVLEVRRGDDLLAELREAFSWIDEPAPGLEYVAVRLRARYLGRSEKTETINRFDLALTGSENVLYGVPFTPAFAPEFSYDVFPGAEVEGWATYEVRQADTNLMLRVGSAFEQDRDNVRYLALEAGASLAAPGGRLAEQSPTGAEESTPAEMGVATVGPTWQIEIVQVLRGQDALDAVMEANTFNEAPGGGLEYVLIEVDVRNVGEADEPTGLTEFSFQLFDADGAEYEKPFITVPSPGIDVDLYPGGQHRGWIAFEVAAGSSGLLIMVDPLFFETITNPGDSLRFFAIP